MNYLYSDIELIKKRLEYVIHLEEYEVAARLRDWIIDLERMRDIKYRHNINNIYIYDKKV